MRPEILWPMFQSISTLKGVGEKTAERLRQRVGPTVKDMCFYLPQKILRRVYLEKPKLTDDLGTMLAKIGDHERTGRRYQIFCDVAGEPLTLVYFHVKGDYLSRQLPEGSHRIVSGRLELFNGGFQMIHPESTTGNNKEEYVGVKPIYGLVAGLQQRPFYGIIQDALHKIPNVSEWITPDVLTRHGWLSFKEALIEVHHPQNHEDLTLKSPARARLAYDEVLADQLAMALVRRHHHTLPGRQISIDMGFVHDIKASLPFQLTGAQEKVLEDIFQDMAAPHRMLRLLMGDVGSGKTIVAFIAMLNAAKNGHQAVFLAPTEILARQQYTQLHKIAGAFDIKVGLFLGQQRQRQKMRDMLESGDIQLAVGTHALLEDPVQFKSLAFAVIDEQHRFGVDQRLKLMTKGDQVDLLVMSATPIPRTLVLTLYGELQVSILNEKPLGRPEIATRAVPLSRVQEVQNALERVIMRGEKAYWVCPLIEESDVLDLGPATKRFEVLDKIFPGRVGLIHGKMKGDEKSAIMDAFRGGIINILVATTVIEVGVDVPDATVMVIEHAERFGLAQLHQLRGRVGRGAKASSCLLLYDPIISKTGSERLKVMRDMADGFQIAEADLKLRGGGDVLGTKQSGMPNYIFADPYNVTSLSAARKEIAFFLDSDPNLTSDRGRAFRTLLCLFGQDQAIMYLKAG